MTYLSRMEIHQIRYFLAVCEQLNFTQAARQCHITQPSLTRAIQRLEKEFGDYLISARAAKNRADPPRQARAPLFAGSVGRGTGSEKRSQGIWSQGADAPESCNDVHDCTSLADPAVFALPRGTFGHSVGLDRRHCAVDRGAAYRRESGICGLLLARRARDPRLNYLPLFREQMMISVSIARRSIEATGTTGPGNDRQRLRVLSEILDFERVRRGQAFS
jgi:LysR family hydrogen peroxide-inducible transcriptional activator